MWPNLVFLEGVYIYMKISRSMKRFVFFRISLFCSYISVCFQFVAFLREHIWYRALLMIYSIRLELTCVCSLNDFLLVMGLYRVHPLFFLECALPYFALFLIDIWCFLLWLCWNCFGFHSVIFPLCVSVSWRFFCVVVWFEIYW